MRTEVRGASWIAALLLASCAPSPPVAAPPILLFNGSGTSPGDVAAVESILDARHLGYATASSSRLNTMSASDLRAYRLLIVPGGNFVDMGNSLSPATSSNIRTAVHGGLHYLGLCAGGLLAGNTTVNGFNLTGGVRFPFYRLVEQDIHKAAVEITTVGAPAMQHYWEDGPQLSGWGAVVARFPDGTPAIVEDSVGKGWVILTGTHPEAPESWRRGLSFTTPASATIAYAGTLVEAALNGTSLPHFSRMAEPAQTSGSP